MFPITRTWMKILHASYIRPLKIKLFTDAIHQICLCAQIKYLVKIFIFVIIQKLNLKKPSCKNLNSS